MSLFDKAALDEQVAQLPAPPQAPPVKSKSSFPWDAALATAGGNLADGISTYKFLHNAQGREGNPVLGQNPASILGLKAALTIPEVAGEYFIAKSGHPTLARMLGYGAGAVGGLLALHNSK